MKKVLTSLKDLKEALPGTYVVTGDAAQEFNAQILAQVLGVDPRAYSPAKLLPKAPLPFISRAALRRVKDRCAIPTDCPYCNSAVHLVNNKEIYGRSYGDWPFAYECVSCNAYVGVHPQTDLPLGTLADVFTREARKAAKFPFMTLVRQKFKGNRTKAYEWLSEVSGIPKAKCHFGMMDEATATQVLKICYDEVMS